MGWLQTHIIDNALLIAVVICALLIQWWWNSKTTQQLTNLQARDDAIDLAIGDLQVAMNMMEGKISQAVQEMEAKSLEDIQVSKQLEHRIKTLQSQLEQANKAITQLTEQQPQDKLYTRAYKLASLGADIDEIMSECELPRAEAEMLLAVYHQKQNDAN